MSSAGVAISPSPIPNEPVLSSGYIPDHLSTESIWIYVAMSGSMIPMRVLGSDSIESVKLQIQSYKGFVVKKQKLVCGGRELARSNSLIRDYGVADGNILHLVLRLSDLQVINVTTSCGKEFTFHIERCRDVGYVKRQVAKKKNDLVHIDDQEVLCEGERLEDQRLVNDICKSNDAVIHLFVRRSAKIRTKPVERNFELSIVASQLNDQRDDKVIRESQCGPDTENILVPRKPPDINSWIKPVIVDPKIEIPSAIWDLVNSTSEGLDRGNYPIRSAEGTGGAYLMLDASGNKYVSVFKPIDEEPMAMNNPRGLPLSMDGEGLKKGTRVGEGALREVAAYILDHPKSGRRSFSSEEKGFAGVPSTVMVKCFHRGFNHPGGLTVKIGSLQMFMKNYGSCEDMGPSAFPVEEVHKISVLDIRIANADRHAGNILVSKDGADGRTVLIPIDHGYCLPESFEDCTFDWLYWPQAHQPYSSDTIEYIKSLDAEADIALLKFYGWDLPLECARTLRISTMLLKKGAERGLTPFAIGSIMCRGRTLVRWQVPSPKSDRSRVRDLEAASPKMGVRLADIYLSQTPLKREPCALGTTFFMCRETLNKKAVIEEIVQLALDSILPGTSEAAFLESVSEIMDIHLDEVAK